MKSICARLYTDVSGKRLPLLQWPPVALEWPLASLRRLSASSGHAAARRGVQFNIFLLVFLRTKS